MSDASDMHARASNSADLISERLRFLTYLPGRYFLDKWREGANPQDITFACRVRRISPQSMTLSVPVCGEKGDKVTAKFDEFGILRGEIIRNLGLAIVMSIDLDALARERLAMQVNWHETRKQYATPDKRRHKRLVPGRTQSTLILADGTLVECTVIDMSVSGAGIACDVRPEIGTPLALGSAVGRVVRYLENGFAIRFLDMIEANQLEARLLKPEFDWWIDPELADD